MTTPPNPITKWKAPSDDPLAWGTADYPWLWDPNSNFAQAYVGTYALNGWCYGDGASLGQGPAGYNFSKSSTVTQPSQVPLFSDSIWVDCWPQEADLPARHHRPPRGQRSRRGPQKCARRLNPGGSDQYILCRRTRRDRQTGTALDALLAWRLDHARQTPPVKQRLATEGESRYGLIFRAIQDTPVTCHQEFIKSKLKLPLSGLS